MDREHKKVENAHSKTVKRRKAISSKAFSSLNGTLLNYFCSRTILHFDKYIYRVKLENARDFSLTNVYLFSFFPFHKTIMYPGTRGRTRIDELEVNHFLNLMM